MVRRTLMEAVLLRTVTTTLFSPFDLHIFIYESPSLCGACHSRHFTADHNELFFWQISIFRSYRLS